MPHSTLIVPGFHGSGPAHWQSWMESRVPNARRVAGIDWEQPVLAAWAAEVRREIDAAPGPLWLVAHSFGCLASVVAAADRRGKVAGMLLVAPAEPARFALVGPRELFPRGASVADVLPAAPFVPPSLLVASRNDPWLAFGRARELAAQWGSQLADIGYAGHVNSDSGHGPWPEGLTLLAQLQAEHAACPAEGGCAASVNGAGSALARARRHTRAQLGA